MCLIDSGSGWGEQMFVLIAIVIIVGLLYKQQPSPDQY